MAPTPTDRPPVAPRRANPLIPGGWLALGLLVLVVVVLFMLDQKRSLTYTEFKRLAEAGQIKKLTVFGKDKASGEVRDANAEIVKPLRLSGGTKFDVKLSDNQFDQIKFLEAKDDEYRARLKNKNPEDRTEPVVIDLQDEQFPLLAPLVWTIFPVLVLVAFIVFFVLPRLRDPVGGGFLNNYIRSPARRYEKTRGRITFEDVAGMEGAKRELTEIVEFLRNPDKFTRLGAQVPKGVLLVGPPGTGKTLLAKAVAGEANVPFFSINGSEFIQMFVGVGASRVRDLFKTAKDSAPCVIFIDEIDAVGRMRGAGVGGGSDEREQTLNQILSEMDGFQPNETVIVLAATNRPDVLDAALLRPGRFDRHVTVDRPTWQGRLAILKVHTRNKPLSDAVDLERVARGMIGMSGADLRNLCNEAALVATRHGKNKIEQSDFDAAADRVRLGLKREEVVSDEEKKRTAYHEAGHALCAWLEPKADLLTRVSIIPRGRTGGVTMFEANEDRIDHSRSELMAKLVVALGGRAADRMIFGEPMSGAIQDLKQATRIARLMVTQFGMSDRLGPVSYRAGEEHVFLGKEIVESRDFSEGTARVIDEEIQRILNEAEKRSSDLLEKNRADLDLLTNALLQNEELDREAVDRLLRKTPVVSTPPEPAPTPHPVPPPGQPAAIEEDAPVPAKPPRLAFGGM
ncbi:ATP-dependent zinc metalloprotease FtsH [Fimbriiglobus ruber]|uniref:ATP-dependent zinc metalloprotease FtsH n=1 Tax=Fimbriiglobus ruber TaxID=1908690 RepID=A0A225DHR1_9BACT|nr:ATP-dependent zinc metalloprotease FtsH [Fimbriiglobus ruber]OWK40523.1 Cell division protein FtsH [Fimbriiglobus ruber]